MSQVHNVTHVPVHSTAKKEGGPCGPPSSFAVDCAYPRPLCHTSLQLKPAEHRDFPHFSAGPANQLRSDDLKAGQCQRRSAIYSKRGATKCDDFRDLSRAPAAPPASGPKPIKTALRCGEIGRASCSERGEI